MTKISTVLKAVNLVVSPSLCALYLAVALSLIAGRMEYSLLFGLIAFCSLLKNMGKEKVLLWVYTRISRAFSIGMIACAGVMVLSRGDALNSSTYGCLILAAIPWALTSRLIGPIAIIVSSWGLLCYGFGWAEADMVTQAFILAIWVIAVTLHIPSKGREAKEEA